MRILFVCTGNTCRSPMAEGLLRKLAKERGVRVEARSAGVAAANGASISGHAKAVLKEQGIEDQISSTLLNEELIDWAQVILTMTQGHKRHVVHTFPTAADKIFTLKEFVEDNASVLADHDEMLRLMTELELSKSLGHLRDEAGLRRLRELQERLPDYDISDPFGGSREDYDRTAAEIQHALSKLLDRLSSNTQS